MEKGEEVKPEAGGSSADVEGGRVDGPTPSQGVQVQGPAPVLVDASVLVGILNQARGPILDRLSRQVPVFTGDGSMEVTTWIQEYEKFCGLERVTPTDLVAYMLGGNAARVFKNMRVGEASQWEVVKAALTAEYAMPRQEAWRRFVDCRLEAGDTIDVYLNRLERFGGRIGLAASDLGFRAKFYEGLPSSIYEWAVTHESAYTADFGTVLSRVRERLVSRRAVEGRSRAAARPTVVAAGKQRGGSMGCFRCGGEHLVRDCSQRRLEPKKSKARPKKAGCFRCGSTDHFLRDCLAKAACVAGPAEGGPNFQEEGADRGGASSNMEIG